MPRCASSTSDEWGPTAANSTPARLIFVRSAGPGQAADLVSPGNVNKVREAPVTVIVGVDLDFHDKLPQLFPHVDARVVRQRCRQARRVGDAQLQPQGGYLIMAARALGLDCGPMSGFDPAKVDAAFWAGSAVKTNFLCALGHGDPSKVFHRNPRLSFDEACRLA